MRARWDALNLVVNFTQMLLIDQEKWFTQQNNDISLRAQEKLAVE